jgi:hypothetical protein
MNRNPSLLFVLLAAVAFAQPLQFDPPVAIEANGTPINVGTGGNASPYVVDWNGDGRQDLLLGQYSSGKVRFYANTDSNFNPVFGDFVYLQADGVDISVSSG